MEDPKLPFIDNKKALLQDETQLEILKQLKRQNALLEEQLALQKEQKRRHKIDPTTLTTTERIASEHLRSENAFTKPRPLSDEMCVFMGLSSDSWRSRTDVTKFISVYVKSHSCFDPTFKRRILPDAKLAKLLRVTDRIEVTYLNLQSFLKVHFMKTK